MLAADSISCHRVCDGTDPTPGRHPESLVDIATEERERGGPTVERQHKSASLDLSYSPSVDFIANLSAHNPPLGSNHDDDVRALPVHHNPGEN